MRVIQNLPGSLMSPVTSQVHLWFQEINYYIKYFVCMGFTVLPRIVHWYAGCQYLWWGNTRTPRKPINLLLAYYRFLPYGLIKLKQNSLPAQLSCWPCQLNFKNMNIILKKKKVARMIKNRVIKSWGFWRKNNMFGHTDVIETWIH